MPAFMMSFNRPSRSRPDLAACRHGAKARAAIQGAREGRASGTHTVFELFIPPFGPQAVDGVIVRCGNDRAVFHHLEIDGMTLIVPRQLRGRNIARDVPLKRLNHFPASSVVVSGVPAKDHAAINSADTCCTCVLLFQFSSFFSRLRTLVCAWIS